MTHLTIKQAQTALHCSRFTIAKYIRDGKLDASKPGGKYLITAASVERLLESTRV